ncbi:MAG: hypothetical protein HIU86_01565 [Acidobacteria bacterium]|nr:hypothetical protein [Acidobacteriota bacterium]
MTSQPPAVRAYLDDLRRLLDGSPDRDLVVDGVRRHIDDALAAGPADPAQVRAVLDELGDPAAIAAESVPAPVQPAAPPPFLERRGGAVLTVVLLTFGGIVVPVAGWIVGLGLLWSSKGWRLADKLVGTLLIPVVLAAVLMIGALVANASGPSAAIPAHVVLLVAFPVLDLAVGVFLLLRFRVASGLPVSR